MVRNCVVGLLLLLSAWTFNLLLRVPLLIVLLLIFPLVIGMRRYMICLKASVYLRMTMIFNFFKYTFMLLRGNMQRHSVGKRKSSAEFRNSSRHTLSANMPGQGGRGGIRL